MISQEGLKGRGSAGGWPGVGWGVGRCAIGVAYGRHFGVTYGTWRSLTRLHFMARNSLLMLSNHLFSMA